MTDKQERFVEEYLVDLNATQAAIRAGYKPDTAGSIGAENLKKPQIRARIDTAMAELSKRTGVNQERVIRELAKVAFVNPTDVIDFESAKLLDTATTDGTPVSGGGNTREDVMLSNITHREELVRTLRQAKAWVRMVDSGLEALDDGERRVLECFYIHRAKGNVDRLYGELNVEKATVYRRRDTALRSFTIALYGVTEN